MRKAILLLVLVVVLVCGAAAVSLRSRVATLAPAIGRDFGAKIGANVSVGNVDVSLFPLSAKIRDVRVSRREPLPQPFLTIDSLRVDAALPALFAGRLDVRALVAERPRIEVVRDADGRQLSNLSDDLLATLAKLPFAVRVVDGGVRFEDRTVNPARLIVAERLDGTVEGTTERGLVAKLQGSVLGSGDDSTLDLELKPDVGARGGDHVKVALRVKDGRAEALQFAFVVLRRAELTDPVAVELELSGLTGERSSEIAPAEPMLGTLKGSVGVVVAGVADRLEVDVETALNDRRFEVRRGKGKWSDFAFAPSGWVTLASPHKLSGRLDFDPIALAAAAERFGFSERWRPTGNLDLTIRATGSAEETLIRHEGKIDSLELRAFPALPIKASSVSVSGALVAINTDISASLTLTNLEVGTARLDQELVGINYWKGKLSVNSLDAPFYDGNALGSVAFEPAVSKGVKGGFMFRDADVEAVLKNVAPRLPLNVYGRVDTILDLKHDGESLNVHGRTGIHQGRIAGVNWIRQLVSEALTLAGRPDALAPIAAGAGATLADVGTRFTRIAVDFETGGGTVEMPRFVLTTDGAEMRARGAITDDGSVTLDGTLLPEEALGKALTDAAPALGGVKTASGSLALPFSLRSTADATTIATTPTYRDALAAALAGKPVPPLEVLEIKPADFGPMLRLEQQFGR